MLANSMLNVDMLSVNNPVCYNTDRHSLCAVMLSVVMLSVIILSVMALRLYSTLKNPKQL